MPVIDIPNYLDAIVENHPTVHARAVGSARDYANLVHESGDPIPDQTTLDATILQMKKDRMWLAIQEERTRRQAGGVFIQSANKWFHSDQTSRIQQLGLVMMGNSMPTGIQWKTLDGSFIEMTPALALSIFNAAATLDMQAFGVAEQHRAYMNASATPETYDFSAFWPATYGG